MSGLPDRPCNVLKVFIHSMFVADSVDGRTEFVCDNAESRSLREILSDVTGDSERVLSAMIDETGRFRPNVAVFFDSDQQLRLETPDVMVGDEIREISIFPALSGG